MLAAYLALAAAVSLAGGRFLVSPAPDAGGRPWPELFAVYVDGLPEAPPVAGAYSLDAGALVFEPRYPLTPGVRYRAEVRGGVHKIFEIPEPATPPASVVAVYPTADVVPENLLKFYVHFSAPMSRGEAYRHIRLLDAGGEPVELPFLEIEQELWDSTGTRLTLLFDPGRIKRGLTPHHDVGLALAQGGRYTLSVGAGWPDANRQPLKDEFRKTFQVAAPDHTPPDPKTWRLSAPRFGSREPLAVIFPEPLDHALLGRVLSVTTVSNEPVDGEIEIDRAETRWRFTPAAPWDGERYHLQAEMILEDLAGNSIGRPFEVDVFEKVEDRVTRRTAVVEFATAH